MGGGQVSDCGGGFNREGEDRGFVGFWAAGLAAQGKHTSDNWRSATHELAGRQKVGQ
jgi:hypothetical protein